MKHVSLLLFLLLACGLRPPTASAQTTLQAGDVLLLGYTATDPDDFAFTPLVNLEAGTQLKFTDNGWQPTGGFRLTEGICTYTAPAGGVPRGTIVSLRADSLRFSRPARFQLAADGDQILVYQGSEAAPTFLCGLAYKKTWSSVISSNTSALPPGLAAGSSALYVPWANGAYAAGSPRSGTVAGLRSTLAAPGSWAGSNTARVSWLSTPLQVLATLLTAPPAGVDSLSQKLYSIFGQLDVSQIPTGYLYEGGVRFLELRYYDGVLADSNRTDMNTLRYLWAQLHSSHLFGPDTLPGLPTFNARVAAATAALARPDTGSVVPPTVLPLAVQYVPYARLRPDALTANLLSVQNEQLFDVAGRPQSPYQVRTLFAAAPARSYARSGDVSFVFRRSLYLSGSGAVPTALALDFGDGQGYRPATWEQPLGTTYPSAGLKRVKVRCTYAGGASYESWFDFTVQGPAAAARYANPCNTAQCGFTIYRRPPGARYGATVSVRYGRGHGQQIVKPFFVVEQYNIAAAAPRLKD